MLVTFIVHIRIFCNQIILQGVNRLEFIFGGNNTTKYVVKFVEIFLRFGNDELKKGILIRLNKFCAKWVENSKFESVLCNTWYLNINRIERLRVNFISHNR